MRNFQMDGMEFILNRSKRKTISIRVMPDLSVLIKAPYGVPESEIRRILTKRELWIKEHRQLLREKQKREQDVPKLTEAEKVELREKAVHYIPSRVRFLAPMIGVTFKRITIRNQKTRWGSCSSSGGLNFNYLLMLAPPEILDYVVIHELCHRKYLNHSPQFYAEVEKYLPNYRQSIQWLKKYGDELMCRD